MAEYAYCRVSTREQNEDRQIIAMKEAGVPENNIFLDKQSGKDFDRPEYQRMLNILQKGDVLFVKSIDRLGRNYDEIKEQWAEMVNHRGVDIVVLDMPLLDTRQKNGDLTGRFISDLVLQILAYVAETERRFIRQRQAEGFARAKRRGVQFGRKKVELPDNFRDVRYSCRAGRITVREGAALLNMSPATFARKVNALIKGESLLNEVPPPRCTGCRYYLGIDDGCGYYDMTGKCREISDPAECYKKFKQKRN